MVDIIVKRIDENMINNMPGGYILDKMNNQNGTSFQHQNVIFRVFLHVIFMCRKNVI